MLLVLALLFSIVFVAIAWGFLSDSDWSFNILKSYEPAKVSLGKFCFIASLLVLAVFSTISLACYASNKKDLVLLQLDNEVNIPNQINMVKTLNSKVMLHTDNTHLIVDVANMGQSAKNTDEWRDLVRTINKYNKDLLDYKFAQDHVIQNWIVNGPAPSPGDLKYIKLNEL